MGKVCLENGVQVLQSLLVLVRGLMTLQMCSKLIPLAEVAEPVFLFYFFPFFVFMLNFSPLISMGYLFSAI